MTSGRLLELATLRHRAGELAEARELYGRALEADPDHPLTLFRSGLLELQSANPSEALGLIERAAALDPDPRFAAGLGQVLHALGRHDEAAAAYARALCRDPASADAQFGLGLALQSAGRHLAAISAYEAATALAPGHFAAWNNLGNCRQRAGRLAGAADAYRRALALRPREPGAIANLGTALLGLGSIEEAVALLGEAAALEPDRAAHAINLGIALCRHRDFAEADAVLARATALDPTSADAAFNRGNALHGLGRPGEAAECYRQAIALRPGFADAWINMGNMRRALGEWAAAAAAYEAALQTAPESVSALNNLACLHRLQGRFDDAEDLLRRALELDPNHGALHDNLGSVLKDVGELDAAIECFRRAVECDPSNAVAHGNLAYALGFQSPMPQPILDECRRWAARFADPLTPPRAIASGPGPGRLRIGYVSADFRRHCQSSFTLPLLSHHDHTAFEIHCYASVERADDVTTRIAGLADVWHDVGALDDAALADLIRRDRIDILVDLTMHMARGRPLTFARRPAPVQLAWLAYPGTTGMQAMDYRISDPRLDPPDFDDHYTERTVRLPDAFWCYDPLAEGPDVNELPALEMGRITFGCLNNPCKLTDATLRLWGCVLNTIPGARLTLLAPPSRHRAVLAQRLARAGIAPQRVDFAPYRDRDAYLRAYRDIDIGLDTLPYNGHTTTLDALWMGVPTVTRVGATCVGRGSFSQLFQVGLTELAAADDDAFVAAAVALALDLPRLAQLRGSLRARLEGSPLMDGARFTGHMESALRTLWSRDRAAAGTSKPVIIR
jgi:predicted O-linked N-acetylglucosamine transferase (SPINDLY family)